MKQLEKSLIFVLMAAVVSSCAPEEKNTNAGAVEVADKPIQTFQTQLLDLAFDGVSAMPLRPHIKNRSRAQLNIVDTCIELGQPTRALSYIEQIANWQRWMGTANLAFYLAENGYIEQSRELIGTVQGVLKTAEDLRAGRIVAAAPNPLIDTLEDWRYQAVLARIAEVRMQNQTMVSVDADEEIYGAVNAAVLMMDMLSGRKESFDGTLTALRGVAEDPNFEIVHLGLLEMAELVETHYDRINLAEFIEENVSPKLNKQMPLLLRTDILRRFAEAALNNGDNATAGSLLDQVEEMAETLKSSPRIYIPEKAKLVQARLRAGRSEQAASGLQAMISVYQEKRDFIVDIERAELLCRIAETAERLGNREQALQFYTQAVAEGQVNPNSRPQAEDLNRICCSMALYGVEPTEALRSALNEMKTGLGEPW